MSIATALGQLPIEEARPATGRSAQRSGHLLSCAAAFTAGLVGIAKLGHATAPMPALISCLAFAAAGALVAEGILAVSEKAFRRVAAEVASRRTDRILDRVRPAADAVIEAMGGPSARVARQDADGWLVWPTPGQDPVRMAEAEFALLRRAASASDTPLIIVDAVTRADQHEVFVCRYVRGQLDGQTADSPAVAWVRADGSTRRSYFDCGTPVEAPAGGGASPSRGSR